MRIDIYWVQRVLEDIRLCGRCRSDGGTGTCRRLGSLGRPSAETKGKEAISGQRSAFSIGDPSG